MHHRRLRLIVLFGGRSAEHDVSCVSARHVVAAADPAKYEIEPIGITREGRWVRDAEAVRALRTGRQALGDRLSAHGEEVDPSSVLQAPPATEPQPRRDGDTDEGSERSTVVMPMLHGPMGEDGTVQGLLELARVPYIGAGVLASALCMDKVAANLMLAQAGIAHTRWRNIVLDDAPDASDSDLSVHVDEIIEDLGLPVFIKPSNMGSSVGVSKASTRPAVAQGLRIAGRYDRRIIIEEESRGREIEVAVLGNDDPEASVPGEIVPGAEFYDYADKYADGAELHIPAELDDDETATCQRLARDAYRALRVEGLARVDFFYEDGSDYDSDCDSEDVGRSRGERGWLVNEVNTMPGFTPISMYPKLWAASGLEYGALIDRLVDLALQRHARRERHTVTTREP